MNAGKSRLGLKKLLKEESKLINILVGPAPLVKGTVYRIEVKCGKMGCRCEREGKKHKAWQISRSENGKSQTRCLRLEELHKYKKMARNYRQFRKAREILVKIHKEQMEIINELEMGRRVEDIWEKKR